MCWNTLLLHTRPRRHRPHLQQNLLPLQLPRGEAAMLFFGEERSFPYSNDGIKYLEPAAEITLGVL